ncbi:MAG TPA: class I SAM-dependent DNA methyltransferase [Candidatus Hydrogenedentes bacterium]|nr:class I SAM-dependent DNA methyltransferase [Candidatus Hydrogenedentota bacterium]HPG70368.1 class I SAM-dependent DNA methyltransferase [Candidatus Hydrogenedentota bacterium]
MTEPSHPSADAAATAEFIRRWKESGAAERANAQLFLSELCDVLGIPHPDPAKPDDTDNAYAFERHVIFHNGDGTTSDGLIDLYKQGCFVLEAKQGADRAVQDEPLSTAERERRQRKHKGTATRDTAAWERAMMRAKAQAENYVRALPADEGRPPFVAVVDVGYCIELYSEFTRSGGNYVPFPDPRTHRILLDDLAREDVRDRLRLLWSDAMALDPSRRSARVTREIANRLARLAQSLEGSGHSGKTVADFLMRCLFTMFAEDVKFLPEGAFTRLLEDLRKAPAKFKPAIEDLWRVMNTGGFHSGFMTKLMRFNGGLFAESYALELNRDQIELLIEAAKADWRDVEPAIFGTLLERALAPEERHKLGAHYTPRAYVERLVLPTIVQPLRDEWAAVQAAAFTLADQGKDKEAKDEVHRFHRRLCSVKILDPACGSGNFLYVSLEHLKRLEGELFNTLIDLGETQTLIDSEGLTVDPHQLLGIEINPRAVAITELVLWIGYLQWHHRTHGDVDPPEPIIKNFHNIECRDAVLAYDQERIVIDPDTNKPVTRWDGRTFKKHPVTGEDVPDESGRVNLVEYINPKPAQWPEADFIVGNPPFIGTAVMRQALGDGYTETLRKTIKEVPESCDYVTYWWNHAAHLAREGKIRRFGFIATNSLRQTFNRRVLEVHMRDAKKPLSLVYAIPDHPWVDAADGAAVRISMTVGKGGRDSGLLQRVAREVHDDSDHVSVDLLTNEGMIHPDLTTNVNVSCAVPLGGNGELSCPGVKLHGAGFIVTCEQATELGLHRVPGLERHIREYRNGRDLTQTPRDVMVIDLFGLEANDIRKRFPEVYQWVYQRVKPERDAKAGRTKDADGYAELWWLFGKPRSTLRGALVGLSRYIATVETSKHRFFVFLDENILPDNMLVNIALDDAYALGVLSSRIHVTWALAQGGTLEDRPRYNKSRCFETFPFPEVTESQRARIRELGEALDAHRKRQQAQYPNLTMTGMYNVLEKLRSGEALSAKEHAIHEQGLVSVLKELHDDLDAAVFDAYGWPHDLEDEAILERLVALNAERAAEERQGIVRWLRPEYQCPGGVRAGAEAGELVGVTSEGAELEAPKKAAWPKALADQAQAVRGALAALGVPATADEVARTFVRARTERVAELLQTLASLGQCRVVEGGRYVGA